MHQHPRTEEDRRVALGWIGRQLAWENRLQTLRDDSTATDGADQDDAVAPEVETEVETAA
jgi:hypothetical protein